MPDDILAAWNAVTGNDLSPDPELLAKPDLSVLRMGRRSPPSFPLDVMGAFWRRVIEEAAQAASCPPDYVAMPLLASASGLIGHARWAMATPGWAEPPHLWCAVVGDSGGSKSPGSDILMRDVLPAIERRMVGNYPDRMLDWKVAAEAHSAAMETWKAEVRQAAKKGAPPPPPPRSDPGAEPQAPRLRQTDVTIERVASLLAGPAPKGLLIVRDELAGWLAGMRAYNDAGRAFWIEAYGGRPYRVERQKHPEPIDIPRLAVAVTGGTQPDKLAELMAEADDGLLARFCWAWPDPVPFDLSHVHPSLDLMIERLDRLRLLELAPGTAPDGLPQPIMVPLRDDAVEAMRTFGREMQERQQSAGGLMRSALGKARGTALRLSLVLEFLWWCAGNATVLPPAQISNAAFAAAAYLVADYMMPMAERVYGDAAASPADRNAATLARWIVRTHAETVHVRTMQREIRLPGLTDAEPIHAAGGVLVDAGWLLAPAAGDQFQRRGRKTYVVNPLLWSALT